MPSQIEQIEEKTVTKGCGHLTAGGETEEFSKLPVDLVVGTNRLERFVGLNEDSCSNDNSKNTTLILSIYSGQQWLGGAAVKPKSVGLGRWELFTLHACPENFYNARTAAPSGNSWTGWETNDEPSARTEWLSPLLSRISHFSSLGPNWDGYGGEPIGKEIYSRAREIALKIAQFSSLSSLPIAEKVFVVPLSSGGISFEITTFGRELHMSLDPDRSRIIEVLKVFVTSAQGEVQEEMDIHESRLAEVLLWVFHHM